MDIIDIIARKRDGAELRAEEIAFWVDGLSHGRIPDYQSAALLMAGRINGFTRRETAALTEQMLASGLRLDLSDIPGIKVDKHSTGGVGATTSLLTLPLAAAAGLRAAKMSGRGLGHTGGTLDKLESIPGFCVDLSIAAFKEQVRQIGLAIISQSQELVPADKVLYALRDVTATVDSIPLIAASIMSKKLATGADILVLDVKYGNGALIQEIASCRELAQQMIDLAKANGVRAMAMLTSMEQPLGFAVGNALEVREALDVLEGAGPADLRSEVTLLAGGMFLLAGIAPDEQAAQDMAAHLLDHGDAREKFAAMVRAQGGCDDFSRLPCADRQIVFAAEREGWLTAFDTQAVGHAAMLLGAGRKTKEDAIDPAAGLVLQAKLGSRLRAGDTIAVLHCSETIDPAPALELLRQAVVLGEEPPAVQPLAADVIR